MEALFFVAGLVFGGILGRYIGECQHKKSHLSPEDEAQLKESIDRVKGIDPDPNNPKE